MTDKSVSSFLSYGTDGSSQERLLQDADGNGRESTVDQPVIEEEEMKGPDEDGERGQVSNVTGETKKRKRPRLPVAQLEHMQQKTTEFFFAVHVRVTGIDSMEQSMEVEGDVHLVWKVPKGGDADKLAKDLNSLGSYDSAEARAVEKKTPVFFGPNLFSSTRDMAILAVDATATGSVVHVQAAFRGFIEQSFNYKWFPFDRHYLTLVLRLRSADEWIAVDAIPRSWTLSKEVSGRVGEIGGVSYSTGPRVTDWRFGPDMQGPRLFPKPYHVQRARKKGGEPESAVRQLGYPTVMIPVERRSSFYLYSFFMPLFAFVVMSFTAFLVTGDGMGGAPSLSDRLSITLSLLLSTVAFKFTVSEFIPVTSHTTLLDKYLLLCLGTQSAVVAANASVDLRWHGDAHDEDAREDVDLKLLYSYFGVWLGLNLVLAVVIWKRLRPLPNWLEILQDALQWNRGGGKGVKRSALPQSDGRGWVANTHRALVKLAEASQETMADFKKQEPSADQRAVVTRALDLAWTATGGAGTALFDKHLPGVITVRNREDEELQKELNVHRSATGQSRASSRNLNQEAAESPDVVDSMDAAEREGPDEGDKMTKAKMGKECEMVVTMLYKSAECLNNAEPRSFESARRLCVLALRYAQNERPLYGDLLQELAYSYRWLPGGGAPLLAVSKELYESARDFSQFCADRAEDECKKGGCTDARKAKYTFWELFNRRRVQTAKTNLQSVERRMFLLADKDRTKTDEDRAGCVADMLKEWEAQHKEREATGKELTELSAENVRWWCEELGGAHAAGKLCTDITYNADVVRSYDNRALIFQALLKSDSLGMQRWACKDEEGQKGRCPKLLTKFCQEERLEIKSPLHELLTARLQQMKEGKSGKPNSADPVAKNESRARKSIFKELTLEARRLLKLAAKAEKPGTEQLPQFPVSAMLQLGYCIKSNRRLKSLKVSCGDGSKQEGKGKEEDKKKKEKTEEELWQELQDCAHDLAVKVVHLHNRAGIECDLGDDDLSALLDDERQAASDAEQTLSDDEPANELEDAEVAEESGAAGVTAAAGNGADTPEAEDKGHNAMRIFKAFRETRLLDPEQHKLARLYEDAFKVFRKFVKAGGRSSGSGRALSRPGPSAAAGK